MSGQSGFILLQTLLCSTAGEKNNLLILDFLIPDFFPPQELLLIGLGVCKFKAAAEIALFNLLTTSGL